MCAHVCPFAAASLRVVRGPPRHSSTSVEERSRICRRRVLGAPGRSRIRIGCARAAARSGVGCRPSP
ncbi:hypothetical protein FM112_06960 [Gulosibacter sp. 10]|nr:hypothetical protein FM112_06960 [Gulosibacter sp. 10]